MDVEFRRLVAEFQTVLKQVYVARRLLPKACLSIDLLTGPCRSLELAFYPYQTVLSFGAPVANRYKIMVDNVGSMLFETNMVSLPSTMP